MIFSRFFSPSHTSSDPSVRLKAIEKLSPTVQNEKSILHELAFNDDNEQVSLAALHKLDAFSLWLKMSQIAKAPRLQAAAQAKVECALIDGETQLSVNEAKEYLLKSAPVEQIVRCLPLMTDLHNDESYIHAVLNKVGRSSFYFDMIANTPVTSLRLSLIRQCDDLDLLLKVKKKCRNTDHVSVLQSRIETLKDALQKPLAVVKSTTLVLSKMQALLDKTSYPHVKTQAEILAKEYQVLFDEFDVLDNVEKKQLEQKYQQLSARLERYLIKLEGPWQASQRADAHREAKQQVTEKVKQVKQFHKQLQGEQLLSFSLGEVSAFQQAVEAAQSAIDELAKYESPAEEIESLLESYQHIWDGLPILQRQVATLQHQVEQWRAQLDNSETQVQTLDIANIMYEWRQATEQMSFVPVFLENQWQQLNDQLAVVKKAQQRQYNSDMKHGRKSMSIIENMISKGKFNAAFAKFNALREFYLTLPTSTQSQLEKRFLQLESEIARLEGWQRYIAAPRRPQLIEQAEKLVETVDSDMPARAKAVQLLRAQWQSLGSIDSDADYKLAERFDDLLEQAFEPCRVYFAEREALQAQAADNRLALIEKLAALLHSQDDMLACYQRFEALKRQWQQSPHTSAEQYVKLRTQWDNQCDKVNQWLSPWLRANFDTKANLVTQAESLLTSDDIYAACDQAKALQSQWKAIGPSGKRAESKLWFSFKAANDAVFSKAKTAQKQRQTEQRSTLEKWHRALDSLIEQIEQSSEQSHEEQLQVLRDTLKDIRLSSKEHALLLGKLNKAQSLLSSKLAEKRQQATLEQVGRVVALFESANAATTQKEWVDIAPDLPLAWWQGRAVNNEQDAQHAMLTLEVLAQLTSPTALASERSTVQLQLMQRKLEGQALPDTDNLIARTIASAGRFETTSGKVWQQRIFDILREYGLGNGEA